MFMKHAGLAPVVDIDSTAFTNVYTYLGWVTATQSEYDAYVGSHLTDSQPMTRSDADGLYALLAPAWVSGRAYVLNELTLSSGTLYRVSTAHTSGGSFDATKFTSVGGSSGPTTAQAIGYAIVFGGN